MVYMNCEVVRSYECGYDADGGGKFPVRYSIVLFNKQPRADAFEISPAGPLFGPRYLPARGEPGRRETALLQASGIALEDFRVPGVRLDGGRRPYRVPIGEAVIRGEEEGLVLTFTLPAGSYATAVLREVMKNDSTLPTAE